MALSRCRVLVGSDIPGLCAALHSSWVHALPSAELELQVFSRQQALQRHVLEDIKMHNYDAAVLDPDLIPIILRDHETLLFVQSTWAGVEPAAQWGREHHRSRGWWPNIVVCRLGGCFGSAMAEYCFAHILGRERRLADLAKCQREKRWCRSEYRYRELGSLTLGLLGIGSIGSHIAKVAKMFGMRTMGYRRTRAENDELDVCVYEEDEGALVDLLSTCDYVINSLPGTADLCGLLDGDVLRLAHEARVKRLDEQLESSGLVLINIGRGDIISEQTLLHSLNEHHLAGAVLDVFPKEPLPASSALWGHPGVQVTPHVSGISQPSSIASLFVKNYKALQEGRSPSFPLDWEKGY